MDDRIDFDRAVNRETFFTREKGRECESFLRIFLEKEESLESALLGSEDGSDRENFGLGIIFPG